VFIASDEFNVVTRAVQVALEFWLVILLTPLRYVLVTSHVNCQSVFLPANFTGYIPQFIEGSQL